MKDEPTNIFDQASKQMKKKPLQVTPSAPPATGEGFDAKEAIESIHAMRRDLENQMDALAKKAGTTLEDVVKFAEDPNNVPLATLKRMQEEKQKLEEQLWKIVGTTHRKRQEVQKTIQADKKGRAKMIGGRRRWLDMR